MHKGIKVGIALEGGGAKGAYQTGVLRALKELNIKYDLVAGTSIGALNATAFILGDYEKSANLWNNTNFSLSSSNSSTVSSDMFEMFYKNINEFEKCYLSSNGIDPEPYIQLFKDIVDEEAIRSSNIEFGITTYCLSERKPLKLYLEDIPEGYLHEFIFASCNLPVFKPRKILGKNYLDGCLVSRLPIDLALEKDCDVVIAVRLRPEKFDYTEYKHIKIIDIAPNEILGNTLEANPEKIAWMIKKGYEDAIRCMGTHLPI